MKENLAGESTDDGTKEAGHKRGTFQRDFDTEAQGRPNQEISVTGLRTSQRKRKVRVITDV